MLMVLKGGNWKNGTIENSLAPQRAIKQKDANCADFQRRGCRAADLADCSSTAHELAALGFKFFKYWESRNCVAMDDSAEGKAKRRKQNLQQSHNSESVCDVDKNAPKR